MSITVDQGKELIKEFCAAYPVAYKIDYKVRETQEELYGEKASKQAVGTIIGGYIPGDGQFHRGRCDLATANVRDQDDFKATLRHEILGHFGINTFTAREKKAVLDSIIEARKQPGLSVLWASVDKNYEKLSLLQKAEEVYAFACETIDPQKPVNKVKGEKSLRDICIDKKRKMQISDLVNITSMVSDGLRDRSRSQQIFPSSQRAQFRRDTIMEDNFTVTEATEHSLYKGLDPYFARVQGMENKDTRDRMTMIVLELDCALNAQEAGHKDTAVQHFKNLQQLARRVVNSEDNHRGAGNDIREIMSDLMRGSINDGKEAKPWSKTLAAIAEENNARMSAGMNLQLAPIAMTSSAFVAPRRNESITLFDVQHIQPAPAMPDALESYKKPAADYVWARPEYKTLAAALQPLLDRKGGEDYRKDALVAMICLRTVNNTEKGIISVGKNGNNKEELEKYSEFRGRLAEYIGKLNKEHGFTKGEQQHLQHLHQPVADHARNFEKTMKSGSVLSRVFAFASSLKSRFMGASAPAHDKVEQKSLPAPKA